MRTAAKALTAALILAALALPGWAAFVPGTEDVPLAPGLEIPAEQSVVFDQPSGRIVEATASGPAEPAAVERFYAESLPQLGWKAAGKGRWTRAEETLSLTIARQGRTTTVRFTLTPQDRP
ncbi:hypothetical protein HHL28_18060 [Aerophototrophica crusticola]|uniref:Uncharacterized protein n=1 Tax=Aerophototrophica crusticola TaxID=1709002 RepID=A0A858RBH6_9PROT|nr:hypothetical protein HHL28_18060 [Rhodospirillaceae bacterium B3]